MKMVILKVKKNTAVALRDDGTFVKVRQRGYRVGQTVDARKAPRWPQIIAAGIALFLLIGGSSAAAFQTPYSYVMMDINPSIKYTLNMFDRVLAVEAINQDADPVVDALAQEDIAYDRLDDAIEKTIERCREDGYLNKNTEDYVVLSVTSRSETKTSRLSKQLSDAGFGAGLISAKVVPSTMDKMEAAEHMGTTPGKLKIISDMQKETGDTQAAERWLDVPVRDIIQAAADSTIATPNNGKPDQKTSAENGAQQQIHNQRSSQGTDKVKPSPSASPAQAVQNLQDVPSSHNLHDRKPSQEIQMPEQRETQPDMQSPKSEAQPFQDPQTPRNTDQLQKNQTTVPGDGTREPPEASSSDALKNPASLNPNNGQVQLLPSEGQRLPQQERPSGP